MKRDKKLPNSVFSDRGGTPVFDNKDIPAFDGGSNAIGEKMDAYVDRDTRNYTGNSNKKWYDLMDGRDS